MFNIKVFASFEASANATSSDRLFLTTLIAMRQALGARHVGVSICDYSDDKPVSTHVLTYPMDWIAHYLRSQYCECDPLLSIDYRRARQLDWQEIYATSEAAPIFANFVDAGLGRNGITIIVPLSERYHCGLTLVFDCPDPQWSNFKSEHLELFRFEADRIGDLYLGTYQPQTAAPISLTRRERQVLSLVAQGRTDEEIAALMGLGKWTIVSHLQSAKCKLGSANRTAAVATAITNGIITLKRAV
ncbi:MAG: autoinducer binding domain-containing protein [Nitratireductor sp.]|nr:autoinducer binding domain-containing protein [Nitratireductor sp.]